VDDVHGWDALNEEGDPMDDRGHGTHVAGTIGAVGGNGLGVVGVCWEVSIMGVKFLGADGGGWTSDAIEAIEYATRMGARVLNNSWGGGSYSQALKDTIEAAGAAGIVFVAAAGNDSRDNDLFPTYPSSYDSENILAVMASDRHDRRSAFSHHGRTSVDLAAPGSEIWSTVPGNGYDNKDGTSMAVPHVVGACALLLSLDPSLTVAEIKAALLGTVDPTLPGLCVSGGRLNLARALGELGVPWLAVEPAIGAGIEPGDSVELHVRFSAVALPPGRYEAEIQIHSDDQVRPVVIVPVSMIVLESNLELSVPEALVVNGPTGGPFAPASQELQLRNTGEQDEPWEVAVTAPWLTASPLAGWLAPGAQTIVTVAVNEQAQGLPPGPHTAQVSVVTPGLWSRTVGSVELLIAERPPFPSEVVGRHVFYNHSAWDGNDPTANPNDDRAIAPDKRALQPGETATFANYTSYVRGLNGLMVDILHLPGTPTAADLTFRAGNDGVPAGWSEARPPAVVAVRRGEGVTGSHRLTLIWDDGAIRNRWLEVTVLATAATGLPAPDVFYFGNAIGESGNSPFNARVDLADEIGARNNPRSFLNPAAIDDRFDFDRNRRVDLADQIIARNNGTTFLSALSLIRAPQAGSAPSDVPRQLMSVPRPREPLDLTIHADGHGLWLWLREFSGSSVRLETTDELASGEWRPVPASEVKQLRDADGWRWEVRRSADVPQQFFRVVADDESTPLGGQE
jgi:hypothetical protein